MSTKKNNNEMYFEWCLDELKENGYITDYKREPNTFTLLDNIGIDYIEETILKTKIKKVDKTISLFKVIVYTPDYVVYFTEKGKEEYLKIILDDIDILSSKNYNKYKHFLIHEEYKNNDLYEVYFDVKPPSFVAKFSSKVGSSREFPLKQRLMFERYKIYVNKVVPTGSKHSLFNSTFIPKRYYYTDSGNKKRKL